MEIGQLTKEELTILQFIASQCNYFSKKNIVSAAMLSGAKSKNSEPYLLSFIHKGIIEPVGKILNVSMYTLNCRAWLEIMRSIQPDKYKWVAASGKNVGIYSHDYESAFSEAVHAFLHGLPYQDALRRSVPKFYYGLDHSLMVDIIDELADERELWPLYCEMDETLLAKIILKKCSKVSALIHEQKDMDFLSAILDKNPNLTPEMVARTRALMYFYHDVVKQGRFADMLQLLPADSSLGLSLRAMACVQRAEYDAAVKLFVTTLKKVTKSKYFKNVILNYYYAIALAGSRLSTARTKINALLKEGLLDMEATVPMGVILMMEMGKKDEISIPEEFWDDSFLHVMALSALVCRHYHIKTDVNYDLILGRVDRWDILLLQMELSGDFERYAGRREELARRTGMHPSLPSFVERPQWEVKLEELLRINKVTEEADTPKVTSAGMQRIAYKMNVKNLDVQPILQKSRDGINWTAGRNIAIERFGRGQVEGMMPEDQKVAACVYVYSRGWYGGESYELSGPKAVAALVGHPLVFDAQTKKRLDVVEEKPVLAVSLENGHYVVKCDIDVNKVSEGYHVCLDGGGRMKVTKVLAGMKTTIATLWGLQFPPEAKEKLTTLLTVLSSDMIVMSDLLKSSDKVTTKRAHPETVVRLQPMGEGIQCNLVVKPFATMPPLCKPGKGMQTITAMMDGRHVQTTRNLDKERANYEAVTELMVNYAYDAGTETWLLASEECLELLDTLRTMPSQCVIEWPEGERFRVSYDALRPADFSLSLGKASNWFELTGEVKISDKMKLKMADLMERLSRAKGNFIQVGDKEYVRIAADLRRHIDTLSRIASTSRGKMRVSTFNVPQLADLEQSGMQMTTDRAYRQLLQRVEKARVVRVEIPKTINADLRTYQKEGYLWMSRLALWGAGALLADDMGLGKTVQAITLLLSRAKEGPQLVIVPTSLMLNWRSELERFAPGLNALMLNRPGEDRKTLINGAKAYDVVITTYGLLITEDELLASRRWTTVVLDEAHIIKNRDTKMSKAAMELKADARLLLTGTPLQNHVSEVWNLMQFANPGLLGTFQEFTDRFILPIERDHDRDRQRQLKRIITPFILRRTKTDVLAELPEKTEITLRVDLSEEEWAFYENIRQRALASLENGEATAMQALAEITRLRQAACNAGLVQPDARIPSSKLESLLQLVQDLHANHHRALVFSQFTSHLSLVRRRLDQEGIQYLYLDGTTPAKERARLTEEFQHGDVPLFLISLKAGGLGLNLTAANYVVHLDPWWNPAIEDQASDRTHRMGQKNPVTVYRLIAAGTIEEKILALHQTKKNMADALLEGGDVSATMSCEEMMELIRECN